MKNIFIPLDADSEGCMLNIMYCYGEAKGLSDALALVIKNLSSTHKIACDIRTELFTKHYKNLRIVNQKADKTRLTEILHARIE